MHCAEYIALDNQLSRLYRDLERQETNGSYRACILLRAALVAGGSLLSRIEEFERINNKLLRADAANIYDGIRRLSVDDRVDSPLSLEERKLALEERRLEVEVRDRAIARFDNAKAAAIARLDNAKAAYKAELDRYVDYLSTADSARDARPTDSGNVFGQLRVYTDNISASNHECKVATYRHLFFRSKDLLPLAAKFQAICLRNARVVACQIDNQAPVADRTEEAFAKQVVRDMAPRLRVILAEVVGLANIHIQTLHKNSGVDIGLTAYSSDYGRTEFFLPIEVKNVFGADTNTNRVPERNADNYRANEDELRAICCQEQQLNPEALWHAFSQIAHYMEHGMPQANYSMMAEITNELAAYHRLKGLQGVDIPRLFEHGYGYVDGEEYAVLIMERICEPALIVESMMFDERPVFKELKTSEKTACVNALGRVHRHGVSHNDVRGANLLFRTAPDGQRTPVFIDFGFAEWASKVNSFARCCKHDYVSLMNIFETNGNV
ncbi:hypothetical protein IWW50_004725 [Coemansia erecta]|nr:hypothetical protein IWW50_004725 [Coemansia erecta]